jgi:glycosyltransferase involved in cell wall biosynthesis
MTAPTVSVVIPTRNRWQLLSRTLGSALSQEAVAVEVVVVDDGSDDQQTSMTGLEDSRVKLVRHQYRQGPAAARNSGVREARAPWIAFLDDDDLWAPHRLRSMLDAVGRADGTFAYSAAVIVDEHLQPLMLQPAPMGNRLMPALLGSNTIPGGASNGLASATLFDKTGGFDESLSFLADWDMWIRLAEIGQPIAVPEVLIAYSRHSGSWVLREDPAIWHDLKHMIEKHAELSRRNGVAVDIRGYERYIAHSLWLAGHRGAAARRYLSVARDHRDPASALRAARAFGRPDLVARLGLAKRPPPPPEWLKHYASPTG